MTALSTAVSTPSHLGREPSRLVDDAIRLWLIFAGEGTALRAVGASTGAPRRGRRVAVRAPKAALGQGQLFLLVRREPADVVLAVSDKPEGLEKSREGLGKSAAQYEVRAVPVVQGPSPR